jgi:hypothetical protein
VSRTSVDGSFGVERPPAEERHHRAGVAAVQRVDVIGCQGHERAAIGSVRTAIVSSVTLQRRSVTPSGPPISQPGFAAAGDEPRDATVSGGR